MNTIEITESNYQSYLGLDIVAFSFAHAGAMGEPGGILIIDRAGQVYHANYYWGNNHLDKSHIKDIIPVFTDLGFGLVSAESANENWVIEHLGYGNSLVIIKDIYDEFKKKVEEANFKQVGQLYKHWEGIILSLLGKNE
jgi:hypothetical protein